MNNKASDFVLEARAGEEPISEAEIAALAYFYWQQRGCPFPVSGEEEWRRAEKELKERRSRRPAAGSAARFNTFSAPSTS